MQQLKTKFSSFSIVNMNEIDDEIIVKTTTNHKFGSFKLKFGNEQLIKVELMGNFEDY